MLNDNLLASIVIALVLLAPVRVAAAGPEDAIRDTLAKWTRDFNAGNAEAVCALFSPELRYDFRGYPERDYRDICNRLQRSLADTGKTYVYALDLREILVSGDASGDLAVARLVWTLRVTLPNGQVVTSVEPGMDVLRKEADGSWKIIRYLAYEAPERVKAE